MPPLTLASEEWDGAPTMTTTMTINKGFVPRRSSQDKPMMTNRTSSDLPNGSIHPGMNGITGVDSMAIDGHRTESIAFNGRPSGGSGTYSREGWRSRDGSLVSTGPDGGVFDSGRRGSSRPSSANKILMASNGYAASSSMTNGGPVLPTSSSMGPTTDSIATPPSATSLRTDTTQQTLTAGDGTQHVSASSHPTVHRLSSPPIFRTPSPTVGPASTTSSIPSAAPPPLRHRHTLQVPKLPTARTSRELQQNPHTPEDGTTPSGRFSTASGTRRASLTLGRRTTRSIHSDVHMDELPPDEDAARWTEAIRQKRTSRRRRKEEDDDGRVVMGTKVDQNHVNWVTAYNMLTGIRFTVSRTNAKLDRPLTDADFHARHKFSFDITGNELTPSAKYDFKFKDYAPWVFRHLRASFKLDPGDYLMSLTSKYILSELGSPGKSGSFFYFSRDYKYIIKTIHHSEHKVLRKVLKEYYEHVQNNPDTLLSQFYGLHRVKIPYGKKIHFVVMNNLFPPHRDIHQTFDLKGSTIGRDFKEEDLAKNPRATLKDLNWLRRGMNLELGPAKRDVFLAQVQRDVQLLQRLNIMDYSLLVGIHDLERGNEEKLRDKTLQVFHPGKEKGEGEESKSKQPPAGPPPEPGIARTPSTLENARKARELRQMIKNEKPVPMDQSTSKMPEEMLMERAHFTFYGDDGGFRATHEDDAPGEVIYYLGIIDCLTHYGTTKKLEHFFKGLSQPKSQISPIAPESYGDRFVRFIKGITKSREEARREKYYSSVDAAGLNTSSVLTMTSDQARTERVMEKAERSAHHTEKDGPVENEGFDRTLIAPSGVGDRPSGETTGSGAGGAGGGAGHTLPIVEEAGEGGSTSGRSREERENNNYGQSQGWQSEGGDEYGQRNVLNGGGGGGGDDKKEKEEMMRWSSPSISPSTPVPVTGGTASEVRGDILLKSQPTYAPPPVPPTAPWEEEEDIYRNEKTDEDGGNNDLPEYYYQNQSQNQNHLGVNDIPPTTIEDEKTFMDMDIDMDRKKNNGKRRGDDFKVSVVARVSSS
ncbi:MAG: hypothetical protein M1823_005369 [Watsoniomyces obsoletus]|nr:MAG: hypothetical protein M1823_005369 [Watsoniomyces obsoletus]